MEQNQRECSAQAAGRSRPPVHVQPSTLALCPKVMTNQTIVKLCFSLLLLFCFCFFSVFSFFLSLEHQIILEIKI